jgi:hypothetical protein
MVSISVKTLRLNLRRLGLDSIYGGAERAPFSLIEGEVSHDDKGAE